MGKCVVCGNNYDKSFDVVKNNESYTFDSFECAIHKLAPECEVCKIKIVGHGLEADGRFFCCDHCAETAGIKKLKDRI